MLSLHLAALCQLELPLDIVARVWKLFLDIYALLKLTKHVYIAILSKASMIPVTM